MDFHVDIGPQYEGETIRKDDMHVEFGGPNIKAKFALVTLDRVLGRLHGSALI